MTEIADLPDISAFGFLDGRDRFGEAYQVLFARPELRLLRTQAGSVVAFRNDDVRRIAAHPEAGNTPPGVLMARSRASVHDAPATDAVGAAIARLVTNQVFTTNPPLHGPTRNIFARHFMPQVVARLVPRARAIVGDLLDESAGRGAIDFEFDFAERLTARFWGALLGMTEAEQAEVVEVVRAISPMFYFKKEHDELVTADQAAARYLDLVAGAVLRTRRAGGNALVDAMADELEALDIADDPDEGGVMPENIGMMLAANLIDGFHTGALAAANTIYALLRNPEALARVREDSTLVPAAAFEGLRLEPPVIVTQRYALGEIEHDGVRIPAGTPIVMLWAAANRDPEAFPDPEAFRLDRPQRGDATFGGGGHICPGRNVARMFAQVVVEALVRPDITLALTDGPYTWLDRSTMRQLQAMPVVIDRTTA
ncbi:cytochrome P450 [Phenylobacterium sp.]|uniref:cytochrome P450 n=1 Tax=Phenylobacterium sp. TaxID=1871053 RepID=UPI002EDAA4A4